MEQKKSLDTKLSEVEYIFKDWAFWNHKLQSACLAYIKEVLFIVGNKLDIDEKYPVSVPYDGGNHPEYASNCFSDVLSVYCKDDCIYLETEDCKNYGIENINTENLYYLVQSIKQTLEENYEIN